MGHMLWLALAIAYAPLGSLPVGARLATMGGQSNYR